MKATLEAIALHPWAFIGLSIVVLLIVNEICCAIYNRRNDPNQ